MRNYHAEKYLGVLIMGLGGMRILSEYCSH